MAQVVGEAPPKLPGILIKIVEMKGGACQACQSKILY